MSTADRLRGRATDLRRIARILHELEVRRLIGRAGSDIWIGPTADRCVTDVLALCSTLDRAEHELVRAAVVLERQADQAALAEQSAAAARVLTS